MQSKAVVETRFGAGYLKRLCRHFAHKVPVSLTETRGRIELPFAVCRIETRDQNMQLMVEAENAADVEKAEQVIADHLIRMANKDEPVVNWVTLNQENKYEE